MSGRRSIRQIARRLLTPIGWGVAQRHLRHTDPDCGGYWTHVGGTLRCVGYGCGARVISTETTRRQAQAENDLGSRLPALWGHAER